MSDLEQKPSYDQIGAEVFRQNITSPSTSPDYFLKYHKPLIEEAKASREGMVRVLALACGHGFELEFMKDDPRLQLIGVDLSRETLATSTSKRLPNALLIAADVDHIDFPEGTADVGIIVNGLIYNQHRMLRVLLHALRLGSKAAANFPVASHPVNREFAESFVREKNAVLLEDGSADIEVMIPGGNLTIKMLGIDYRRARDPLLQPLGVQSYFQTPEDAQALIDAVGFQQEGHEVFPFESTRTKGRIETDVFIMRKPG